MERNTFLKVSLRLCRLDIYTKVQISLIQMFLLTYVGHKNLYLRKFTYRIRFCCRPQQGIGRRQLRLYGYKERGRVPAQNMDAA